jgi:hypothetical protein
VECTSIAANVCFVTVETFDAAGCFEKVCFEQYLILSVGPGPKTTAV